MKINLIFAALMMAFTLTSCEKDDQPQENALPIYTATIMSPSADELPNGESFHIHVNFDEENDLTIHHINVQITNANGCLLYTSPSPRDQRGSRMPSSA